MLTNGPGPVGDKLASYRLACCGLKAFLHVLEVNELPPPKISRIRSDGPIGLCCGELTITPKAPTIVFDDPGDVSCVGRCIHRFELCFTRCISDWFGMASECETAEGSCEGILSCPPDEPWEPPGECGKGATKADEHALVLADRTVISLSLAEAWACCISDPAESGCGDCSDPLIQSCRRVEITDIRDECEGGCAGTIWEVEIS